MKKYFYVCVLVVFLVSMPGLVLPALVSARSNEAVLFAGLLAILSPLVVIKLIKLILSQEVKNEAN